MKPCVFHNHLSFDRMFTYPLRILAFGLAVLLLGCAGTPVPSSATLAEANQKAIVILSVSHDSEVGSATHAIFYLDNDRIADRAVLSSVQTVLSIPTKSDFQDRRGHLYVLELPPGQHQIDTWQVATNGNRVFPRSKLEPLKFEVRKGEVLYLGDLHADIEMGRVSILLPSMPVWAAASVVDRSSNDTSLAETRVPSLKGRIQVATLPLGAWGSDRRTLNKTDPMFMPILPKK